MRLNFHNAMWRSRAVAILGFVAMLILIFPGLPSPLKTSFLLALCFAITCLGLAGSRHKAYHSVEAIDVAVIESRPAELAEETEPAADTEEAIIVSLPEEEAVSAESSAEPKE